MTTPVFTAMLTFAMDHQIINLAYTQRVNMSEQVNCPYMFLSCSHPPKENVHVFFVF